MQTIEERYIQSKGCKFVDEIVPYTTEQDFEDILRSNKIGVRVVGTNTEIKILPVVCIANQKGLNYIIIPEVIGFRVLG